MNIELRISYIRHSKFEIRHLLNDPEKMRNLRDDATHRRSVRTRNLLVHLRDAQAFNDCLLALRVADRAAVILDRNRSACVF